MTDLLTPSNIMFTIGIFGVVFGIWGKVREPQEALETKQAISEKDISSKATILAQKEAEGKASLLAQKVEWEKVANEKRFGEMGIRMDAAMTLANNHIHTIDTKVEGLTAMVGGLRNDITKLATIVEERMPRK